MTDLNSVVLIGNLTRDAELKYFQNGTAVAAVSIAVNSSRKQQDGTYADEVSFFDVNIYGKTAENLKQYLTKGKKIAVEGSLKQDRWQDSQTGQNRSRVVVNADTVQLLGGKEDNSASFNQNIPFQSVEEANRADAMSRGYQQTAQTQPMQQPPTFQQPSMFQQNGQQGFPTF